MSAAVSKPHEIGFQATGPLGLAAPLPLRGAMLATLVAGQRTGGKWAIWRPCRSRASPVWMPGVQLAT